MKPILEIQSVSKKFSISHEGSPYLSLRDKLSDIVKFKSKQTREDFWALKDINFNVMPGESIGIIGKNGAGKSTLLKILSKITPPSAGKIISRGRIASLLEVGTGFHPELTGRENIYLNGSILGMKKKEIDSKFDEIVDFAGTERFLDTQLKHYSSGMQLRLAFAVAAFLEPEILVIDEVLAVGDAQFQKKCLGKMEDVTRSGRTILFVSHNMAAVQSLCKKSVLLNKGSLEFIGNTNEVVNKYLDLAFLSTEFKNGSVEFNGPTDTTRIIKKVELYCNGSLSDFAHMGCLLEIKVHFSSPKAIPYPVLGVIFRDSQGTPVLGINNNHYVGNVASRPLQEGDFSFIINSLPLINGSYSVDIHFGDNITDLDVRRECMNFMVEKMPFTKAGVLPDEQINKFFVQDVTWRVQ
ncbi:MAG: ABC transporter ATP-binding protein [Chryseolinea sp.]